MYQITRIALRPALLSALTSAQVYTAAAGVPAASWRSSLPACAAVRHWASASGPSEEALRKAERMVELMGESPQLQQMILGVMPGPLRNPEVVKQLFSDPAMRKRIAEMIASRGLSIPDHLLDRMTPGAMDSTFARAQRMGLDPGAMFAKLMAHPGLMAQLQQPRVMAAFLDIAQDPARQAKYEGDKELLEIVFKAREILGSAAKPPSPPSGNTIDVEATPVVDAAPSSSDTAAASTTASTAPAAASSEPSSTSSTSSAVQPPPPGQPPRAEAAGAASEAEAGSRGGGESTSGDAGLEGAVPVNPLVSLMRSDPKAARWLDNPQVMAALEEDSRRLAPPRTVLRTQQKKINKSPWKTLKYVLNRDVMEAFKDLSNLMRGKKTT